MDINEKTVKELFIEKYNNDPEKIESKLASIFATFISFMIIVTILLVFKAYYF